MIKEERQKRIAEYIRENGIADVKTLAKQFDVTEMTIRRDLLELDKLKIINRTHGGAVTLSNKVLTENPFEIRAQRNIKQKKMIAKLALSFINNGEKVFFDSSTTVLCLAKLLNDSNDFLIVTDTLTTALVANSCSNTKVVCLGGEVVKATSACSSYIAEQMLDKMTFTTSFISVPIVSIDGTISVSSMTELSIKKRVIDRSTKKILLFDSSKLGPPEFLQFATIKDFDVIITDDGIDPKFIRLCNETGVKLLIAKSDDSLLSSK